MNNSVLLQKLGLGSFDSGIFCIAVLILIVLVIVLFIMVVRQAKQIESLQRRLKRLMSGKDGESLEDEIAGLMKSHKALKSVVDISRKDIEVIFHQMRTTYQKTGLVKYDAFQQMGGQLSFCLALLDQDNNGFIMNSVHSTEGCYCYTKEVKGGVSELSLGTEEEEALALAMGEK